MKKKALLIFLLAAVGGLAIGGTMAFFTDRSEADVNTFTVGNVALSMDESFDAPISLEPGETIYEKEARVTNTGTADTFIRLNFVFSDNDVAEISELSSDGGDTWYPVSEFKDHLPEGWAYGKPNEKSDNEPDEDSDEEIDEDSNEELDEKPNGKSNDETNEGPTEEPDNETNEGPTEEPDNESDGESDILDGYYYYTLPVAPGESTAPLFTHVRTTFTEKVSDKDESINHTVRDYCIYLYAEGIQQQALDGSKIHTDYGEAWITFLSQKDLPPIEDDPSGDMDEPSSDDMDNPKDDVPNTDNPSDMEDETPSDTNDPSLDDPKK